MRERGMSLINTQLPESAQDKGHRENQEEDEDRDHSFKRQAIDSLAHCSFREHTRDWTRVYPFVAVTHTS